LRLAEFGRGLKMQLIVGFEIAEKLIHLLVTLGQRVVFLLLALSGDLHCLVDDTAIGRLCYFFNCLDLLSCVVRHSALEFELRLLEPDELGYQLFAVIFASVTYSGHKLVSFPTLPEVFLF
jgi:hypothetical protein